MAAASNDSELQNNLGIYLLHMNDLDHAIAHFNKAIALNNKNVAALSNLAVCYVSKGDLKEAERLFRVAVRIDPRDISARQNLEKLLQSHPEDRNEVSAHEEKDPHP